MRGQTPRQSLIEGARVGLKAFIISYIISLAVAAVLSIAVLDEINDLVLGEYGTSHGISFGLVMKTASMVMHIAVFNTVGSFKIGLLFLAVIPFAAFYIADRQDNRDEGFDARILLIFASASATFSLAMGLLGLAGKGPLLTMELNYFSFLNIVVTFVITFLIQAVIGMNYGITLLPGGLAARRMVRVSFGAAAAIGLVGLIILMSKLVSDGLLAAAGVVLLLPNVAVYVLFLMMGVSIEMDASLQKLMAYAGMDASFSGLPAGVRVVAVAAMVLMFFFVIGSMRRKRYFANLAGFSLLYPAVAFLAAYCTGINLGLVKNIVDIKLGIDLAQAFFVPFAAIWLIGLVLYGLRRALAALKRA